MAFTQTELKLFPNIPLAKDPEHASAIMRRTMARYRNVAPRYGYYAPLTHRVMTVTILEFEARHNVTHVENSAVQ